MEKQRLAKYIAKSGISSRRACEQIIFDGRVKVNGQVTLIPQTMVDNNDVIVVDGKKIGGPQQKLYLLLNKPRGYVCSNIRKDREKIVLDLFANVKERLFTVGRLDRDTEGLIIITNDGHFSNKVIHPSANIHKEYIVKSNHEITANHLKKISAGTEVEETFVKPINVTKIRRGTVRIVVAEGKKREVRRLVEASGLDVRELKRVRIGNLRLGDLPNGSWRHLTEREKEQIFE